MSLVYNNLIINKNSNKYAPFLVNLVSGRRRVLSSDEFMHVSSMLRKANISDYTDEETTLYDTLTGEKQFLDDKQRKKIEAHMLKSGYFDAADKSRDGFMFSVQLTQDCNMHCAFCFERGYADNQAHMSEEKIDAIFNFYKLYGSFYGINVTPATIRVTGGEPLINQESVDILKYIVNKWPDSKIILYTNGSNLIKFYDQLPIGKLKNVDISLDGLEEVHLHSRKPDKPIRKSVYNDIILGIKRLLNDQVAVNIKSVLSKENYINYPQFVKFLQSEGVFSSPYVTLLTGIVIDFSNPLDIDESFNNVEDTLRIQAYLQENCGQSNLTFDSISILWRIITRPDNNPYMPRTVRCDTSFLSKCYFSPNGNVYFCDCMDKDKNIIGTYYPEISLDEKAVKKLASRSVMNDDRCKECAYKFVCFGSCPLSSAIKGKDMSCGAFVDQNIMDNLEYPYYEIMQQR